MKIGKVEIPQKTLLQLAFLIILIGTGFYFSYRKKKLLAECSIETTAVIIDKYKIRKRGWSIRYFYEVDGMGYESSESLSKKIEVDSFFEGKSILIKYSCEHPDYSKFKPL